MDSQNPAPTDMTGQWVGWSQPDNGQRTPFLINTESRAPLDALVTGDETTLGLRSLSRGTIIPNGSKFSGKTHSFLIYDPASDRLVPLAQLYTERGMNQKPPTQAEYTADYDGRKITGQFKNDLGVAGTFELFRSFSEALTGQLPPLRKAAGPMTWQEFKKHVSRYHPRDRVLFRGQHSNEYPLRTSLHRKGRNDLFRYLNEDVDRLRHRINAISHHYYQPAGEDLFGLVSLAQHHGFPTPLLDWTESPYVAAFFAFDCLTPRFGWLARKDRPPVRIFTFDRQLWDKINRLRARTLRDPWPDFQFFHPPAHNNPRYYPQQSVAAFSNVDDIEDFVMAHEIHQKQTYITRIDIHASEREQVEDDLRFMGISAATLFPGLEGACKSLSAELF
jgi:hypothetical protein